MPEKDFHITPKIACFSFAYAIIKVIMLFEWYFKNYATLKVT